VERRRAEELQKKHPKRWRYNEKILGKVRETRQNGATKHVITN
jgi:hypothetical protein